MLKHPATGKCGKPPKRLVRYSKRENVFIQDKILSYDTTGVTIMDLDTFFTTLYVLVDDWYTAKMAEQMARKRGQEPQMSDSEVLTVALAGQWRVGVPWRSERGVVRYMQAHGRGWFPKMLQRSAFNERVRNLWAVFVHLQQTMSEWLRQPTEIYEVVDCVPLPACSIAQTHTYDGHWLWWSTKGYGGTQGGWYWGEQACASVLPCGAVTGWIIASAHSDDRWLLQALISQRHGQFEVAGPASKQENRPSIPPEHMGPQLAIGRAVTAYYLADQGFNGWRWRTFWETRYCTHVISAPATHERGAWSRTTRRWLSSHRQIIETAFSILTNVFDLQRLQAHSRGGQYTRVSIAMAAYNLGIYINRLSGRPDLSHATLIC
jgi:hypothetical protein